MARERLDKLIASQGTISRKDVKQIIRTGMISVNGMPVVDPGLLVDIAKDTVAIEGVELD